MSVPVPIDEMPEPKKERVAPPLAGSAAVPASAPVAASEPKSQSSFSIPQILQIASPPHQAAVVAVASHAIPSSPPGIPSTPILNNSDLPFKCHLCDSSFFDRTACLDHMKAQHVQEFTLIMGKVNLESESDVHTASPDDDDISSPIGGGGCGVGSDGKGGKYPDYTNRKVICVFCMRRFWSTEDLRRHVRTHSGERPFQCNICLRR